MKKGFYVSKLNEVALYDGENFYKILLNMDNDNLSVNKSLVSQDDMEGFEFNNNSITHDFKVCDSNLKPKKYALLNIEFNFKNDVLDFNLLSKKNISPEDYYNARKIFIDGAVCCSKKDCSGDCEAYIYLNKDWFDNNYLDITGFKNEESFYSNYLYPDSKKILDKSIRDSKLIGIRPCLNCEDFCYDEDFVNYKNI